MNTITSMNITDKGDTSLHQISDLYNIFKGLTAVSSFPNLENIHEITNHPVHIYDSTSKELSPSSLIPLCQFGGNSDIMGLKIDMFQIPVCNVFEAKILNDQLCYEVDPNKLKTEFTTESLNQGLTFYIDTNVDRQYPNGNQGKGMNVVKVALMFDSCKEMIIIIIMLTNM